MFNAKIDSNTSHAQRLYHSIQHTSRAKVQTRIISISLTVNATVGPYRSVQRVFLLLQTPYSSW